MFRRFQPPHRMHECEKFESGTLMRASMPKAWWGTSRTKILNSNLRFGASQRGIVTLTNNRNVYHERITSKRPMECPAPQMRL